MFLQPFRPLQACFSSAAWALPGAAFGASLLGAALGAEGGVASSFLQLTVPNNRPATAAESRADLVVFMVPDGCDRRHEVATGAEHLLANAAQIRRTAGEVPWPAPLPSPVRRGSSARRWCGTCGM